MGCDFPEHHGGGGHVPVRLIAIVLAAAAVAGTARAVHPHVPWRLLAIGVTLAGCAVLALCGRAFARWEKRRAEPDPEPLRWRTGEQMREPRR